MTHVLAFAAGCASVYFGPSLWATCWPKVKAWFDVTPKV